MRGKKVFAAEPVNAHNEKLFENEHIILKSESEEAKKKQH